MGKAELVEKVTALLDEKRQVWEANAEDRRLRNYTETIEVEPIFHSKIIGVKVLYRTFAACFTLLFREKLSTNYEMKSMPRSTFRRTRMR